MHAHRSSYPRISSVPLIRISHLAPTPPGLSCGSGRAQPSGAGLWRGDLVRGWCGTLAYTSCPGLSGAHFKRVVKACFDPPSASAVFSTYLPRFLLLHVVSCIAFERVSGCSLTLSDLTDGSCMLVQPLILSPFGCSHEGLGSTLLCDHAVL